MKNYKQWKEKLNIIEEAYSKPLNIKATARKYEIGPEQIRRWKKKLDSVINTDELSNTKKHDIMSLKVLQLKQRRQQPEVYQQLRLFYENCLNKEQLVTMDMLINEILKIEPNFKNLKLKTLKQRLYRWLISENLVQPKHKRSFKKSLNDEVIIHDFISYINQKILTLNINKLNIINIDEITIDINEILKIILINNNNNNNNMNMYNNNNNNMNMDNKDNIIHLNNNIKCTIVLGISLFGDKLSPFIIFKGSPKGRIYREFTNKNFNYPKTCEFTVQTNGWMDSNTFLQWIQKIWEPYCKERNSTYLLMDETLPHLNLQCIQMIKNCNTFIEFIPNLFTEKYQIFNVSVKKDLKKFLYNKLNSFIKLNQSKLSRLELAHWIASAWDNIHLEDILDSWKRFGLHPEL